jgi:hypothetical protein
MGPDGHFVGVLDDAMKPADIARRLEQLGA